MPIITENLIEKVVDQVESQDFDFEKLVSKFSAQQPAIITFLLADNEGALSDDERDFTLYLALIIWKAISEVVPALPKISPEELAEAEEENLAKLEGVTSRSFRERMNVFFANYPQEDLLAFVEDALTEGDDEDDDEDSMQLTDEGREPMFIALKTVIDVLTEED